MTSSKYFVPLLLELELEALFFSDSIGGAISFCRWGKGGGGEGSRARAREGKSVTFFARLHRPNTRGPFWEEDFFCRP